MTDFGEGLVIRRGGRWVLVAAVLLAACVSGIGPSGGRGLTSQEPRLLAYIPEALPPSCATEYERNPFIDGRTGTVRHRSEWKCSPGTRSLACTCRRFRSGFLHLLKGRG